MRYCHLFAPAVALMLLTGSVSSAVAAPIQARESFTCSSNAECKRKCEALGSDHTWKPNPGGSTYGTCTKRRVSVFQRLFGAQRQHRAAR